MNAKFEKARLVVAWFADLKYYQWGLLYFVGMWLTFGVFSHFMRDALMVMILTIFWPMAWFFYSAWFVFKILLWPLSLLP